MSWIFETLNEEVDKELDALPEDMQARFTYIGRLLERNGPMHVRKPHVEHLTKKLYEMRLRGKDGISRALYVTVSGRRIVVVRIFVKKTQKTPRREIELALKRAKELEQ